MKKFISKVIIVLGFVALLLVPQQCFASGGNIKITVDPKNCTNSEGCEGYSGGGHIGNVENLVRTIIGWASLVVGLASVGFIIWGGVMYSAAFGDPSKIQKAKMIIISAIIGLVIALISGFIVTVVLNGLGI